MTALGKFSLNISNVPPELSANYGKKIYGFLEQLMVKSHYLPLTLDNMNNISFTPK